jgi:hypothetical protein
MTDDTDSAVLRRFRPACSAIACGTAREDQRPEIRRYAFPVIAAAGCSSPLT